MCLGDLLEPAGVPAGPEPVLPCPLQFKSSPVKELSSSTPTTSTPAVGNSGSSPLCECLEGWGWGTPVPPALPMVWGAPSCPGPALDQPLCAPGLTPGKWWSSSKAPGSWRPPRSAPQDAPPGTPYPSSTRGASPSAATSMLTPFCPQHMDVPGALGEVQASAEQRGAEGQQLASALQQSPRVLLWGCGCHTTASLAGAFPGVSVPSEAQEWVSRG